MPVAVIYIASVLLFLGVAPLPYGYYMLLRLVATVVFVWAALVAHQRKNEVLPWVFGLCAIVFNPIIKIHLPKELWAVIDITAGMLLLAVQKQIKEQSNEST
ncbi:DUF6804 family protein [Shewanella pealeana]|uniref:DUF6804 family protein n=1 Tax=Shewanella pealeana TaxID=70864 RepID=UPI00059DBD00|nr:DUF6804 family protein [Shewanella pealeana]